MFYFSFISFFISLFGLALDTLDINTVYSYDTLELSLQKARDDMDHNELAKSYFLMGMEENKLNDIQKSLEYFTRSIEYFNLIKDTINVFRVKEMIASNHKESTLNDEALDLYKELLEFYRKEADTIKQIRTLLSLSELHADLTGLKQSALCYEEAAKLGESVADDELKIELSLHKADQQIKYKQFDKALESASNAFFISDSLGKIELTCLSLYYIGLINNKMEEHGLASKYLQNSLAALPPKPRDKRKLGVYKELYLSYEKRELFDSAYMYSVRYARLKDSILNRERLSTVTNLSLKYKAREKSKEVVLLEKEQEFAKVREAQKNRALYTLAIVMGLLLGLLYFIVRFYSTKMKANSIIGEQEQELNQQKILKLEDNLKIRSMESMIEGQEIERERVSKDLHDSMGGLLSTIKLQVDALISKESKRVDIKKNREVQKLLDLAVSEVRSISQNLQPAALKKYGLVASINDLVSRLNDPAFPEVEFQDYELPELETMFALSIYRIVQELLNNTLKHAKAKEVFIQLRKEGDNLVLSYEDDGVGFDPVLNEGKGMGLLNIDSRVNYLKGELIVDSRKGQGTSYILNIPLGKS